MDQLNQFLYILKPTRLEMLADGGTNEEQAIVSQHFAYLKDLTEDETTILVGRTQNVDAKTIGIVIFKASSRDEAMKIMEADPAVRNGVMSAELFPFQISLVNPAALDLD